MINLAESLVSTLPPGQAGLFNPWRDHCQYDTPTNGPVARLERLARHLDCEPQFILIGEAIGYQGGRYSGIAFTSERLLGEGSIPRIAKLQRLSTRKLPFSEPSATIVWGALHNLGIESKVILWNALQMHPFKNGNIWSNRTPTPGEIALGAPALRLLIERFPAARIVAVGKKSEFLLHEMGILPAATVRHPANGGAKAFFAGMQDLVRESI